MQGLIKAPCFSLWPQHSREEKRSRCPFLFCLDCCKNNFLAVSHLTYLQTTPMSIIYFFNMLVAPTKESWYSTSCPTLIARPNSQPAVTQLYYSSREGSSVSHRKIQFCWSRRRLKLLPGTGYVRQAPFHCCTHAPTHTLTHSHTRVLISFLAQRKSSSATASLPGVIHLLPQHLCLEWFTFPC